MHKKAHLQKTKGNTTKIRKVSVDGNKLCAHKEWRPTSLDGRLIVVVGWSVGQVGKKMGRWAGEQAGRQKKILHVVCKF